MESIDVVLYNNNASPAQQQHAAIISNGFNTRILNLDDYINSPPEADAVIVLVLADGAVHRQDFARLLCRLNRNTDTVKICLLSDSSLPIDAAFSAHFDDIVFCPFTRLELETRVERLTQRSLRQQHTLDDSRILRDFAGMNLVGKAPAFVRALHLIEDVSACDLTVLIEGETGTGKENAARSIHYISARRDQAFIPINCGTLPDELLESELFGHERGTFTDAKERKPGLVEIAENGTLFLDEIDSLTTRAQAALLRFLQTGEYRPLGGRAIRKANVRIIAATNTPLRNRVENNQFRGDLFFRLNVFSIVLPPLRDRAGDIELIACALLEKFRLQYASEPKTLHHASMRWLQRQPWPGNVRELENLLLREFLLCKGPLIKIDSAAQEEPLANEPQDAAFAGCVCAPLNYREAKQAAVSEFEHRYVHHLLSIADGNVSRAARLSGKDRRAIGKLVKKYNIDKSRYQSA